MKPLNLQSHLSNLHIFHISHNSLRISHAGCWSFLTGACLQTDTLINTITSAALPLLWQAMANITWHDTLDVITWHSPSGPSEITWCVAGNEGMPVTRGVMRRTINCEDFQCMSKSFVIMRSSFLCLLTGSQLQISDSRCQPRYMYCKYGLKRFKSYLNRINKRVCFRVYLEIHIVKKHNFSFSACSWGQSMSV